MRMASWRSAERASEQARAFRLSDWLIVLLAALAAAGAWALMNRPVDGAGWREIMRGVSFSPFHTHQSPLEGFEPSPDEVRTDLRTVAKVADAVRTYSSQGILAEVPKLAAEFGLRVTAGAWIGPDVANNAREVSGLVRLARANRNVERVIVGNEALLRAEVTVDELAAYLRDVRRQLRVPVSTSEPWHVWLKHPELAREVDFIGVHILPYWEGVPVGSALEHVRLRLAELRAAFPRKHIVLTEVGWPSEGRTRMQAEASPTNQAIFVREFLNIARKQSLDYFVIEAFDQPWKAEIEGGIGAYWGLFDVARNPKFAFEGPVVDRPTWPYAAGGSIVVVALLTLWLLRRETDVTLRGRLFLATLLQLVAGVAVWTWFNYAHLYTTASGLFALTILVPAFVVLLLVTVTEGVEAAECIWRAHWRRRCDLARVAEPGAQPKVSIHVPCCNEPPAMVMDTLRALAALDYPDFEVLVIDNNTKDEAVWRPVEAFCAQLGPRFRFFHFDKLAGFKAGALNLALRETAPDAELIAVIDSDYTVDRDWLKALVPSFADPQVALVQAPQDYRDADESVFKGMCYWEYAGFFRIGMLQRNERNAIIEHGTMSIMRRSALVEVGGWGEWCITEDAELGLKLFEAGHKAVYTPQSFGRGLMPDSFDAYKRQRYRWAYGAVQILKRHWREVMGVRAAKLTSAQRYHFLAGWLPWAADGAHLAFTFGLLAWTVGMAVWPRAIDLPFTLFLTASLGAFVLKVAKSFWIYHMQVRCTWRQNVGAAIAGLALSHTVAKAMWHGLFTSSRPFLRTPKCDDRPAAVRGLVAAWEETALAVLLIAGGVAVAMTRGRIEPAAVLFAAALWAQAVPYVAALVLSMVNALRPIRLQGVLAPAPASAAKS